MQCHLTSFHSQCCGLGRARGGHDALDSIRISEYLLLVLQEGSGFLIIGRFTEGRTEACVNLAHERNLEDFHLSGPRSVASDANGWRGISTIVSWMRSPDARDHTVVSVGFVCP